MDLWLINDTMISRIINNVNHIVCTINHQMTAAFNKFAACNATGVYFTVVLSFVSVFFLLELILLYFLNLKIYSKFILILPTLYANVAIRIGHNHIKKKILNKNDVTEQCLIE